MEVCKEKKQKHKEKEIFSIDNKMCKSSAKQAIFEKKKKNVIWKPLDRTSGVHLNSVTLKHASILGSSQSRPFSWQLFLINKRGYICI